MSKLDPFIIEEAHYKTNLFMEKAKADADEYDQIETTACVMFLEIGKARAERMRINSPLEREVLVAETLARILHDHGYKT